MGRAFKIRIDASHTVSALLTAPPQPLGCLTLAHGAGAGMRHAFMAEAAEALLRQGIATLRFQFPYMEAGSKRPDRPALTQAAIRAAVAAARTSLPAVPHFAGGKSFGGRMTSLAQAELPLPGIAGLVFLGFPLHPAGKPSTDRAAHLQRVSLPMLFVQGTRDALADLSLLDPVIRGLGARARLVQIDQAEHAFHVPRRTGRSDGEVVADIALQAATWMQSLTHSAR